MPEPRAFTIGPLQIRVLQVVQEIEIALKKCITCIQVAIYKTLFKKQK